MDVNRILLDILVVLLAAKVAAEVADRLGVPAVVAEIAAGVVVGPSVLGIVHRSDVLHTLAELGVILLLLQVGLEMDLRELSAVGRASLLVACVGVAVPLVAGTVVGLGLGMSGNEALFVGAALTATSVGITARVFGDLRALATVEARTVLGAAVADDILGLVILTVVVRVVTEGSVSPLGVVGVTAIAIGFVVVATAVGVRVVPPLFVMIRRYSRSAGTLVALALAFTLGVSELAHLARLAPIVGAFVAGLALARSSAAERVRGELAPIGHLLIPVFFLQIGIDAEVRELARPAVLGIAAALLAVAVVGKLVSPLGLLGAPGDRLLVGIGMIPRGEVGLIFATLGLREHVFGSDVYAALLLVVLATTVGAPPVLRWRLLALRSRRRAAPPPVGVTRVALVAIDDGGHVALVGEPLPSDALVVALAAARLCEHHPPSEGLLEWLDAFPPGPRRWDDSARAELWRLLEGGGPRSWRLLTATGVLQRALPELDDAIAHRRGNALELDPLAALRFSRLAAVRDALPSADGPTYPEALLLAALVLDACDGAAVEPVVVARRTVQRLDLGARLEQAIAGLVADAALLAAAVRRVDALDEEPVLQLAVHLGTAEQARALDLLTGATWNGDEWERERLAELHELVQNALAHPELTGRDAAYEVQRRRAQACARADDPDVRERIEAAPREYVVTQTPDDLLRHAQRCEPTPARDEVRVFVDELAGAHCVEVVARDRVGLIARVTAVLLDSGCSVQQALAVTWGDGTAFSSYRVNAPSRPDGSVLAARLGASLRRRLAAPAVPGVVLTFDDDGSPWHTRCTVEAADRPGLLNALTTAFAVAGANVHAARVVTEGATAVDTFDLTGRDGVKLDEPTKAGVRAALDQGVAPRGLRRSPLRRSSDSRSRVR